MGYITRTITSEQRLAWVGKYGNQVRVVLGSGEGPMHDFSAGDARTLADAILAQVEAVETEAAEAEAAEHAAQREERAVDHAFDVDLALYRYAWVVRANAETPWIGLWDRGMNAIAPFEGGLTEDGRRRATMLIPVTHALPWKPASDFQPFEIAMFA